MNIKICDVCYAIGGGRGGSKTVMFPRSKYRISYKKSGRRIALDVCLEHEGFFKETKSFEEAEKKYLALY